MSTLTEFFICVLLPTFCKAVAFNKEQFCLLGDIGQYTETFLLVIARGGRECSWHLLVEGRDAVNCPTIHRAAPTIRNYLAQTTHCAKIDKLYYKLGSAYVVLILQTW